VPGRGLPVKLILIARGSVCQAGRQLGLGELGDRLGDKDPAFNKPQLERVQETLIIQSVQ
jgi:hypothetical protein